MFGTVVFLVAFGLLIHYRGGISSGSHSGIIGAQILLGIGTKTSALRVEYDMANILSQLVVSSHTPRKLLFRQQPSMNVCDTCFSFV